MDSNRKYRFSVGYNQLSDTKVTTISIPVHTSNVGGTSTLVDTDSSQTIQRKTIVNNSSIVSADNTKFLSFGLDYASGLRTLQFAVPGIQISNNNTYLNDVVMVNSDYQNISNKGIFDDSNYFINYSDINKRFRFNCSNLTSARVLTPPNYDATIATLAGIETLTNKTLEGKTTTFLLESKAGTFETKFKASLLQYDSTIEFPAGPGSFGQSIRLMDMDSQQSHISNKNFNNSCLFGSDGPGTWYARLYATGFTSPRDFTFPNSSGNIVIDSATQTLTHKSFSGGTISSAAISGGTISSAAISGGTISSAAISGGSIANTTTINTSQITNGSAILTLPTTTTNIVGHNTNQYLYNKSLDVGSLFLTNNSETKSQAQISFSLSLLNAGDSYGVSFPRSSGTMVLDSNIQSISNKTITSSSFSGTVTATNSTFSGTSITSDSYFVNVAAPVRIYSYQISFTTTGVISGTADIDLSLLNGDVPNNKMWRSVIPFRVVFDRVSVTIDDDGTFTTSNTFTIKLFKPTATGTTYYANQEATTPTVVIPASGTTNSTAAYNTFAAITYNAGDMISMKAAQSVSRGNEFIITLYGYQT